ncbi:MAG: SDR family NAD(P)-dependent oxidoreductase [Wenzhouxiangellaceae bacterium]|nr:SDR family NAD(P)-dependent oxidoreductase [Wenzhouxiangellaceae bacterium]MBS3747635.1 SDR family NAD(P)-dependent oxidoreductase [Wenzhouxiangellaceae bacterium]MBS3824669.1 SDR family NAD(P)-dependent oxidoreductase [Wenzhouxiangellaceae bacterium]
MNTFIVTGGNRGLGFEIARSLTADDDTHVVIAVRSMERGREAARQIGSNASVRELDLASSDSVDRFTTDWEGPIAGLVNNAGVQLHNATLRTEKGTEQTVAVNHLNALRLTLGLEKALAGGRVMFIGSGTHNTDHPTAAPFGSRGEQFESIANCAEGLGSADKIGQLGKDRYATTKFLNMVATVELARRYDPQKILFLCLDPGADARHRPRAHRAFVPEVRLVSRAACRRRGAARHQHSRSFRERRDDVTEHRSIEFGARWHLHL